jgi:hypothetical protein
VIQIAPFVGLCPREHKEAVAAAARHNLLEVGEVLLFLLVAMTYISSMEDLNVFSFLRAWLVERQFSLNRTFWITGARPAALHCAHAFLARCRLGGGGRRLRSLFV